MHCYELHLNNFKDDFYDILASDFQILSKSM